MSGEQATNIQAFAAVAGVVVTTLGLLAIFLQIRASAKVSRVQNACMFLLDDQRQALIDAASQALGDQFELFGETQMTPHTAAEIDGNPVSRKCLSTLLNHYETIAAGIRCGSLDEEMFRFAYMRPVRTLAWQLIEYIRLVRRTTRNEKVYSELEKLAERWDRWSDAAPHYFRNGQVITDLPFDKLPMPTEDERRRPRHMRPSR